MSSCFILIASKEINELKEKLYQALYVNSSNAFNNKCILKCVKDVINNLPKEAFISKYISLIRFFTEKMDEENAVFCKVLVIFPSNYEQLCQRINATLNLAKLPQDPVEFYSFSNYKFNIENFEGVNKISKNEDSKYSTIQSYNLLKEEINSLKSDINQMKLNNALKDTKLMEQGKELKEIREELKETKFSLFQIQLRDIIKEFLKEIKWNFRLNSTNPE